MKPENTEEPAKGQRKRRREAIGNAAFSTLLRLLLAGILFWARADAEPTGFLAKFLLIAILLNIGSVLPIWVSLRTRLKEIEGGEEDAAAQY